jgi:ribosomal 50S subunit-recycling heat shock protein
MLAINFLVVKPSFLRYNCLVRLDLYLKTSRLVKRRSVARAMCDEGRVLVNGREARPAKEVRQGDTITLAFSSRSVEIEVLGIPAASKKVAVEEIYRVIAEKRTENEDESWRKNRSSQ